MYTNQTEPSSTKIYMLTNIQNSQVTTNISRQCNQPTAQTTGFRRAFVATLKLGRLSVKPSKPSRSREFIDYPHYAIMLHLSLPKKPWRPGKIYIYIYTRIMNMEVHPIQSEVLQVSHITTCPNCVGKIAMPAVQRCLASASSLVFAFVLGGIMSLKRTSSCSFASSNYASSAKKR